MLRGSSAPPTSEKMNKETLKFASTSEDSVLLVWTPPDELRDPESVDACMAIPFASREGGLLLAVPQFFLSPDALLDANLQDDGGLLGPSAEFMANLIAEDENGAEVEVGAQVTYVMVDVTDDVLQQLRDFDSNTDGQVCPFAADHPLSIVSLSGAVDPVKLWLSGIEGGRQVDFFTAREELAVAKPPPPKKATVKRLTNAALADQVATLSQQMAVLMDQQKEMMQSMQKSPPAGHAAGPKPGMLVPSQVPPVSAGLPPPASGAVSKVANLLGPPPKSKPPASANAPLAAGASVLDAPDPDANGGMANAILQQSTAITQLVAHLASSDPMTDLSSTSSGGGLSAKGAARRERMQRDLVEGNSTYFPQVLQQMHRKMYPSRVVPKSEQELIASGCQMTSYVERFGNFKGHKESGMMMWMLSHAVDAAASGDFHMTKEYLALSAACLEQSTQDSNWTVAYVLSLLEEPPSQIFSERQAPVSALGRPFSGLIPPAWAAVALAYLKEMELLNNKKTESKAPKTTSPKAEEPGSASPKRRPKFPKKPKAGEASPKQ